MQGITHNEVRRHPRWREEQNTPLQTSSVQRAPGSRLLMVVGALIIAAAILAILLQG